MDELSSGCIVPNMRPRAGFDGRLYLPASLAPPKPPVGDTPFVYTHTSRVVISLHIDVTLTSVRSLVRSGAPGGAVPIGKAQRSNDVKREVLIRQ